MLFIAYGSSLDSKTPAGEILRQQESRGLVEVKGYRLTFRGGCTSLAGHKGGILHGVAYKVMPGVYAELGRIENSQVYGLGDMLEDKAFILGNVGPVALTPDADHVTAILAAYDSVGLPTAAYIEIHRAVGAFADARKKAAAAAKKAAKKDGKTLGEAAAEASASC